ncbi:MAG TPA: hypothetical protein VH143_04725 [Kofleriaceae bacterium]|nr:hypothetical protein [Kofleriaceae bacterium]
MRVIEFMVAGVLVVLGVWWSGAHHIVHGSSIETTTCPKVGWSLSDTFVDYDDFNAARENDAGRAGYEYMTRGEPTFAPKVWAALSDGRRCLMTPSTGTTAWLRGLAWLVAVAVAAGIACSVLLRWLAISKR